MITNANNKSCLVYYYIILSIYISIQSEFLLKYMFLLNARKLRMDKRLTLFQQDKIAAYL